MIAGRRPIVGVLAVLGLALCALVALWAGRTNAAVNIFVPCDGAGGGPQGLIDAIQAANADGGGTISLERDCTYTLTNGPFEDDHGQDGLPPIQSAVTIDGNGATIARAGGSLAFRLLEVSDDPVGVLTLQDTTLRGGFPGENIDAGRGGGAILVNGPGSALITGSVFTGNKSNIGGAITVWVNATARITDSTFRGNAATLGIEGAGGAIANQRGRLIVNGSLLTGNSADKTGGAIGSPGGTNKLTNTTISDNRTLTPAGLGGGITVNGFEGDEGTLILDRSTLSGNRALGFGSSGGAIASLDGSDLSVTDSTISGNNAGDKTASEARGGGIYSRADDASVTTTTVAGNRVLGDNATGGGLFASQFQPLTVTASIVAANTGRECTGGVEDGGYNLEQGQTCDFTDHAVNGKARLEPLADNGGFTETRALQSKSAARNKIPASQPYCGGTVDQRGVSRPQGAKCDIGSFELTVPKR